MTNHVYLLMTPHHEDGIAKTMQSLGRKYVRYINGTYKRTGTLWEGRYKASVIQSKAYLLRCYCYIELNPVRARMTKSPIGYKWSSYGFNAYNKKDDLITPHEQYIELGNCIEERVKAYRELFRYKIDDDLLHVIRDSTNQCRVLGNECYRKEIEDALQIKATPGKRGRPKKLNEIKCI